MTILMIPQNVLLESGSVPELVLFYVLEIAIFQ